MVGISNIPTLAEELFSSTDTSLALEDVILGVECMTSQRKDMAHCLHRWLLDRSGPDHNPSQHARTGPVR